MAMSEPPILKLVMEKGPRADETLEFRPDSVVRIGRVIRGNTKGYKNNLVIKDGGVSTEHLSIHFDSDSGKWVVQDRGSSNGTVLNDTNLTPNTLYDLHHGDIVKIGELTSISVLIGAGGGGGGETTSRRTTRQHKKADSRAIADNQGFEGGVSKVRIDEGVEAEVADRPRRGRPRKGQPLKSQGLEKIVDSTVQDSNPVVKVRTRGKKNEGSSVVLDLVPSKVAEETSLNLEVANEGNKGRAHTRRGKKLLEDPPLNSAPITVADSKKNQQTSNLENADGLSFAPEVCLGEDSGVKVAADKKADGSNSAQAQVPADEGNADVAKGSSSRVGEEPDLEKMTLGEWFDYLEVHLPKQIIDETEELIEKMREKAIRVHEYRLQQAKSKESVG